MSLPWTEERKILVTSLLRSGLNGVEIHRQTGFRLRTIQQFARRLAEQGELGTRPVLPGYAIKNISSQLGPDGSLEREWIQQKKTPGEVFKLPKGQAIKGVSVLVDPEGRELVKWVKTNTEPDNPHIFREAALAAFQEVIAKEPPVPAPLFCMSNMLSQYTITDMHLGALAWNLETGSGDYDLALGEKLLMNWFGAAIASSPASKRAVFSQLGDFLHYDSFKTVTPEHQHLLDADGRYPLLVRTAIRSIRKIIRMLLEKHEIVDVIMADANHDGSSEVWLREMFAVLFEDEPRIRIEICPGTYNVIEHGDVSLFYHHGHRKDITNVDSVFAGKFREIYGRTRFSYAHLGHRHSDEFKRTNLMKVEQHETLAAPDAYAANGGWLSGRSAKVIHYHDKRGEVSRTIITPEMVIDWEKTNT